MKALECAKAYLLLHPDDEDVLDNVDYYESLLDDSTDPGSIEAREVRPISLRRISTFCLDALGRLGKKKKKITLLLNISNSSVKVLKLTSFKL